MISKGIIYIEDIKVLLVTQGNLGENEISRTFVYLRFSLVAPVNLQRLNLKVATNLYGY